MVELTGRNGVHMDQNKMIEDLVKMLDSGISNGVGHVNVEYDETREETKDVRTMGCSDCASNPTACSIPTLGLGLDDRRN